ncbi:unnamed protein product [Rotaria socialis]|uniref:RING-type domain-containing protein n=1 Tax=Rotaria socialis TaxID=392032 RepID=A0A818TCW4_9BILA|nr:unnamed protein product [Rotaria socialis]
MNYLDLNDGLDEIDHALTNTQTTTTTANLSTVVNQQSKDLSDWRNIQLGTASTIFDRLWMPTTMNSWTTPNTPVYPSPYNQQTTSTYPWTTSINNQSWPMTTFPTNTTLPFINFDSPQQSFTPSDTTNDIIDLTTNTTVNLSTPVRGFIPVQPHPYSYLTPPVPPYQNPIPPLQVSEPTTTQQQPQIEAELILVPETDLEEILEHIEAVIPDIDIDAARRTITAMNPIPSINEIVTSFLDNGYTKKAKKSFDHERNISLKRSWSETMDDVPKFLSTYSDPVTFFFDTQRKQSESYINHAKAFIVRAFPAIDKSILEQTLQEENHHFLSTVRKLERQFNIRTNAFLQRTAIRKSLDMLDAAIGGVGRVPSTSWLIKNNKFIYAIPHTPCEEFYDELRFAKNEIRIRRFLGKVSKDHEKRVKRAKKDNETLDCNICCREDLLIDDMVECSVGHLYCRNCVRTHIDLCFKEGKCRFVCVENLCPGEYTMRLVSELLPPKDLNRLNRRIQEENIRQAEIDGLECCSYCPYAVIVDNPDDKVFRCLNPECMKETCRLCKEPNHIPLRCNEVEKGVELEMRKFIEEHVTEAMIRKCPRCTQRFYKVEGCNKMTCSSCGLFICYVCRETINGYDHFTNNERCTLSNQSEKIHYEEMLEAYRNAKNEYLRLHPEAHDMVLRYDPISHLIKIENSTDDLTSMTSSNDALRSVPRTTTTTSIKHLYSDEENNEQIRGQVFSALRYLHHDFEFYLPLVYIKRRILELSMETYLNELKINGGKTTTDYDSSCRELIKVDDFLSRTTDINDRVKEIFVNGILPISDTMLIFEENGTRDQPVLTLASRDEHWTETSLTGLNILLNLLSYFNVLFCGPGWEGSDLVGFSLPVMNTIIDKSYEIIPLCRATSIVLDDLEGVDEKVPLW